MRRKLPFFFWITVSILVIYGLSVPIGPLPAAGSFFNPVHGFWANAETRNLEGVISLPADMTRSPVDVFYDDRGVPHIFAQNDSDLYFAQGYVTARDRLFQLELQVRASGGMLSEWLGEGMVDYDLNQRRTGILYGAGLMLDNLEGTHSEEIINAYGDGINAYIESLRPDQFPLEFKLLGVEPRSWEPIHSALLLKYMTEMLAGRNDDVTTSNTIAYLGESFVEEYISKRSKWTEPIIPPEREWDFDQLQLPETPEPFTPQISKQVQPYPPDPDNGSNNWAVSGSKTKNGSPLLAGDPHLNMSLPSIWYEIQLHAPGVNVYGVSIPGAPGVIKGFNESVAWSTTNTGADVMDWYEIEFRDDSRSEYLHDGEWLPVEKRVETIQLKYGEPVTETVLYTHHGPVASIAGEEMITDGNIGHALKWIAHKPSDEPKAFYMLNRANNYEEAAEALSHFEQPAQNIVVADNSGNIAMFIAGKLPLKWNGQGMTVSDGRNPAYDWQGWIPNDQNPHIVNPERGFVSSANQELTSDDYPYYLGERFASFERGKRINDLLREGNEFTVKDMQLMQLDDFSYRAEVVLPAMLDNVNTRILPENKLEMLQILKNWDYTNKGSSVAPTIFKAWFDLLYDGIWDDELDASYPLRRPAGELTIEMLLDNPGAKWIDNINTEKIETISDLVTASFVQSTTELEERFGEIGDTWQWAYYNETDLNHLARINGLGEQDLFTDGAREAINAIRGSHGPSWRMVVELGPEVKGFGVYPGGQSGNPGSASYTQFVSTWRNGGQFELQFLREKPAEDEFPLLIKFR